MPDYAHRALLGAYIRGATCRALEKEALDLYIDPWTGPEGQPAFYAQIAQMDQRYTDDIEGLFGELDCPTTILWGKEDAWIPVEHGHQLARRIPDARLHVIPNAGHLVQEDAPEAIVAAVLAQLDEADRLRARLTYAAL